MSKYWTFVGSEGGRVVVGTIGTPEEPELYYFSGPDCDGTTVEYVNTYVRTDDPEQDGVWERVDRTNRIVYTTKEPLEARDDALYEELGFLIATRHVVEQPEHEYY